MRYVKDKMDFISNALMFQDKLQQSCAKGGHTFVIWCIHVSIVDKAKVKTSQMVDGVMDNELSYCDKILKKR